MIPLVQIAIEELPNIIGFLKSIYRMRNPNLPVPTDDEVHKAYVEAVRSSLAKDDEWRKSHPE